jgi:hypothetical protein
LRLILDVEEANEEIRGVLFAEGMERPQRFSGWLDLLRLLEVLLHTHSDR